MKKIITCSFIFMMLCLFTLSISAAEPTASEPENAITVKVTIPGATPTPSYTLHMPAAIYSLAAYNTEIQTIGKIYVTDVQELTEVIVTPKKKSDLTNTTDSTDTIPMDLYAKEVMNGSNDFENINYQIIVENEEDPDSNTFCLFYADVFDGSPYNDVYLGVKVADDDWENATEGATYETTITVGITTSSSSN